VCGKREQGWIQEETSSQRVTHSVLSSEIKIMKWLYTFTTGAGHCCEGLQHLVVIGWLEKGKEEGWMEREGGREGWMEGGWREGGREREREG
jgi:hypothetical protein